MRVATSLTRPTSRRPYICSSCANTLRTPRRFNHSSSQSSQQQSPKLYDVVCVGGGPAGLSLLAALRSSPITSSLKVALIESQDLSIASSWSLAEDRYSNRASSLTPPSKRFLEKTGAWKHVDASRVQSYQQMQVWDGVSGARIEFEWEAQSTPQDPAIAYMTENPNIVRALLRRLEELGQVSVFDRTKVVDISTPPPQSSTEEKSLDLSSWPHLTLSNGDELAARLLVGADGLNSPVRSFAGIASTGWDYEKHGVVATVQLSGATEFPVTAYQRFLPTGPVALLPLPGNLATLVWSTTPSNAALLKSLSATDFLAVLNAAFRLSTVDLDYLHTVPSGQADELAWRLQHVEPLVEGVQVPLTAIGLQDLSVASFPLRLRHADTYATHRVALVGDAAHTIHPLAGQGLNMGIRDVSSLGQSIEYSVSHGRDIGDQLSLERYNAERYAPNFRLLGTVDKLHKLYSVGSGPVVAIRSLGLEAVNLFQPIKQFLMKQAAGA